MSEGKLRIGISGWRYEPWRGAFYPEGLPQRAELEYAARHFNSIEINGSFCSLQRPAFYQRWYDAAPDDFVFAVKGGRFITHMTKLLDVRTALANFLASGVLCLEATWAERVARWREHDDVYVYFDNDAKVHAPFDAAALARALGAEIGEPVRNKRARLARRRPLREAIRGG